MWRYASTALYLVSLWHAGVAWLHSPVPCVARCGMACLVAGVWPRRIHPRGPRARDALHVQQGAATCRTTTGGTQGRRPPALATLIHSLQPPFTSLTTLVHPPRNSHSPPSQPPFTPLATLIHPPRNPHSPPSQPSSTALLCRCWQAEAAGCVPKWHHGEGSLSVRWGGRPVVVLGLPGHGAGGGQDSVTRMHIYIYIYIIYV